MRYLLILFLLFALANNACAWQSPNISDIRLATHPDYTRIVFDLNNKLSYRVNRDSQGNIVVDFPNGIVSPKAVTSRGSIIKLEDDVVEDVKIYKIGNGIKAGISLGKRAGAYKTYLFEEPYRLVIDVERSNVICSGIQKKEHKIDVIIIDPGHGGKDPGAIGRSGLKEKIVVLDITRRVEKLLNRDRDLKIILTRKRDEFVSLDNRVAISNKNRGGLFISIHLNACHQRSAGGFETFYLGESKTDEARSVAVLENSVLELEEKPFLSDLGRTLEKILWDLRLNEFKTESREMAETVQTNLDRRLSLNNRGIKGALLYVLRGVAMPAVLVEAAFISNIREESLLRSSAFRQTIAQAIYESILQYKTRFEKNMGFTN